MPIIKSAQKRMRQETVRRARNTEVKRSLKQDMKSLDAAIAAKDKKKIEEQINTVYSSLDTAAKKNIIHKNKAARKKSDYSAKAKVAGAGFTKSSKKPTTTKKAPTKKATVKKAPAKKTATKK